MIGKNMILETELVFITDFVTYKLYDFVTYKFVWLCFLTHLCFLVHKFVIIILYREVKGIK